MRYIFSAYTEMTDDGMTVADLAITGKFDHKNIMFLLKGQGDSYRIKFPPILFPPGQFGKLELLFQNEALMKASTET